MAVRGRGLAGAFVPCAAVLARPPQHVEVAIHSCIRAYSSAPLGTVGARPLQGGKVAVPSCRDACAEAQLAEAWCAASEAYPCRLARQRN